MKTTMLMLISLFFALCFSTRLSANQPCPQGYDYGGWMAVDTILCYEVQVEYCFKYDAQTNDFQIHINDIIYTEKFGTCDPAELDQILETYMGELIEKAVDKILGQLATNIEINPAFCQDDKYCKLEVRTASCTSDKLIPWGFSDWYKIPGDPNSIVQVRDYARPSCNDDVQCIRYYKMCWIWDSASQTLKPHKILDHTEHDPNGACPDKVRVTNPIGEEFEIICSPWCM